MWLQNIRQDCVALDKADLRYVGLLNGRVGSILDIRHINYLKAVLA